MNHFSPAADDLLTVAGRTFHSRLLTGTGKYKDFDETRRATEAAGAQIVTLAIRRVNIGQDASQPNLLDALPPDRFTLLPNTAGCYTADDAVRTCRLARELLDGHNLVKLEVLGDERTLYPDVVQTLVAAEKLVADGFDVMVYTSDDPILARRLEEIGCAAIMPLAAPIGSGLGIQNRYNLLRDRGEREGAGHRRRGCRHRIRCIHRDGAGLRWRADEHGHRRREGPGADGARDEARRRSRPRRLPRGTHPAQAFRFGIEPRRRAGRLTMRTRRRNTGRHPVPPPHSQLRVA